MTLDADGRVIGPPRTDDDRSMASVEAATRRSDGPEQELEGVFLVRQGRVRFTPIVTGIAGERYFEALSGLNAGNMVVTGPFNVVRSLEDGDAVQINERSSDR